MFRDWPPIRAFSCGFFDVPRAVSKSAGEVGGYFEEDPEGHISVAPDYDVTIVKINGEDVAYNGWDFGEGAFEQDFMVQFYLTVNYGDPNAYFGLALFSAGLGDYATLEGLDDGQGLNLWIGAGDTYQLRIRDLENDASSDPIIMDVGIPYYCMFYRSWALQKLYLVVFSKYGGGLYEAVELAGINQSIYRYFYFANSFVNHEATSIDAELSSWWLTEDVF